MCNIQQIMLHFIWNLFFEQDEIIRQQTINHDNEDQVRLTVFTLLDRSLQLEKCADPFCRQVTRKLTSNDNHNQHKKYRDDNGMKMKFLFLFRRNIDYNIVILFSVRQSVLKRYHGNSGNFNVVKNLAKLRLRYWQSSIRKDTRLYVKGCETCQ